MPTVPLKEKRPELFQSKDDLETPALLADLDTMEQNMDEYIGFAKENDVALRSHIKTHKNPDIARCQHKSTSGGGIVCQTLGEAEIMAANGIDDIYLSYMVIGDSKFDRLVRLSETLESFATTVDGKGNIDPLQEVAARHQVTIDVIVEVDVGLNRTGISPGEPAVEVVKYVSDAPNLDFQGILAYEAHVKGDAETEEDYNNLCHAAMDTAQNTVEQIEDNGVHVPEVKVGGTATAKFSGKHPIVTEINPGMYPFNDVGELEHRPFDVTKGDCAATVLSTVISAPSDDRVIVDAGSKSLSLDKPQMPLPKYRDDIEYYNASEEHGWIDTSETDETFAVGDRLEFIVPHVCTTINLHNTLIGMRENAVEELWDVRARGVVK